MKILHLLSQIPEATGSGIYLQSILKQASKRDFQNYLLAGVPTNFQKPHKLRNLACSDFSAVCFEQDLPFPVVGMSDVMPYPSTRFCDLSAADLSLYEACFKHKLVAAVERWKPDIIHSHHLWLLTSLTRKLFPDIPLVTSCHGSDLRQFQNCQHLQATVLSGCRDIDAICALTQAQKLEIQTLYGIEPDKIHVMGAGYDSERFSSSTQKHTHNPIQVLFAGKLSRAKGVPWLLRALKRLPADMFSFHLVGDSDGVEKQEILELANKLESGIQIHGKIDQEQLSHLLRQTDLFVLPSLYEGLPLVLLEALACGCRIVTTALPGIIELFAGINSDRIILVDLPKMASIDIPQASEEDYFIGALTSALHKQFELILKSSQDVAISDEIQSLLNDYTWEGVFRKIESLYRQLMVK
ncbi:Glycosyltransferase involved in cell wall bisynthesis [Desulfuromusa kysingii]|uniref:Glycosyltransferase involved in cell wall bisynthesis n=1 Tax=Desulfuromusa kysingii TaxID=37625 RepID=A0A1H3W5S8_9BACT|nr:glycosyltransferase family 4 protein [Desulfuromusa kysingii]SDZ81784.1 Glycosyltransferase involved in cell wall bisynthesis [Desulfuromusa kysingii]